MRRKNKNENKKFIGSDAAANCTWTDRSNRKQTLRCSSALRPGSRKWSKNKLILLFLRNVSAAELHLVPQTVGQQRMFDGSDPSVHHVRRSDDVAACTGSSAPVKTTPVQIRFRHVGSEVSVYQPERKKEQLRRAAGSWRRCSGSRPGSGCLRRRRRRMKSEMNRSSVSIEAGSGRWPQCPWEV